MIKPVLIWPDRNPIENQNIGDFVCEGVWEAPGKISCFSSMAVFDGDKLIGGTLFHNWHPDEGVIELTSFSKDKRWLTKDVIRCMFSTPFVCLGCQLVVLRVSEKNDNMIGIARKFGFTETFIPRLRGRDEGEHIFSYTDDQWKASPYNEARQV